VTRDDPDAIIMDAPLWTHAPKLTLWALFEADVVFLFVKGLTGEYRTQFAYLMCRIGSSGRMRRR
jgi:hypothetical protein